MTDIKHLINVEQHPLDDVSFQKQSRMTLQKNGVCVLHDFLQKKTIESVIQEAIKYRSDAYFCRQTHNIYLTSYDERYDSSHVKNRQVPSSKGCIGDDIIPRDSLLRALYDHGTFKNFLQYVLTEEHLYPYADPLSSINIHYAEHGHELGWHFDNSSFAVTLLLQEPEGGGAFQYLKSSRYHHNGCDNFEYLEKILDDNIEPTKLEMFAGTLVLFRGKESLHRVTPVIGKRTRILAVLAYNNQPNISLSETARMTFYGRV